MGAFLKTFLLLLLFIQGNKVLNKIQNPRLKLSKSSASAITFSEVGKACINYLCQRSLMFEVVLTVWR